jgi:hypothetical protein
VSQKTSGTGTCTYASPTENNLFDAHFTPGNTNRLETPHVGEIPRVFHFFSAPLLFMTPAPPGS